MATLFPTTGTMEGDIKAGLISGGVYNPTAIVPQDLKPTSQMTLNTTSQQPVYQTSVLPEYQTPDLQQTEQEKKISGLNSSLQNLYNSLTGKSSYQTEQESKYGVDTIQNTMNDLNSQLTILKNEASAIPLQMDKRISQQGTILTSGYNSEQEKKLRDNSIAALGISSLMAAAQGQLSNAQSLADKAVAQKYDPILEQIDIYTKNLEIIKNDPETTLEEKNRAQKQIDIQTQKADKIEEEKTNTKTIFSIATEAASNAKYFVATKEYPNLSQTLNAIQNSKTKEQALNISLKTNLIGFDSKSTSVSNAGDMKNNDQFTTSQFNKGAANAGVSLKDFENFSVDSANLFINNMSDIEDRKKSIDQAWSDGEDESNLEEEISSSNLPLEVKDYLVKYLKQVYSQSKPSKWNPLNWFK